MKRIFLLLILQVNILFSFSSLSAQDIFCDGFSNNLSPVSPECIHCKGTIRGTIPSPFLFTPILQNPSCFELENYSLFSLLSNSDGEIDFNILKTLCFAPNGVLITADAEGVIYDPLMNEVPGCFTITSADTNYFEFKNLIPNEFYTLLIDGTANTGCFLIITNSTKFSTDISRPEFPDVLRSSISNHTNLCVGEEICFSIDSVPNATSYYWQYPQFLTPISKKNSTLCVKVNSRYGDHAGFVKVNPFKECNPGHPSFPIYLNRDPIQFRKYDLEICHEKLPFFYLDSIYEDFGFHEYITQSSNSCGTHFTSIRLSPLIQERSNFIETTLCVGEEIQVGNEIFNTSGSYEVIIPSLDSLHCDSTIKLNLEISGDLPPQIQCVNDTFLNVLSINWDNIRLADGYFVLINGDTVSDQSHRGFFYTPNPNGEQIDLKIQPYNSRGCSFEAGFASCLVEPTTGVFEENLDEKIRVFPNPSDGLFQIKSAILIEKTTVLNIFGEKIFETNSNKIDLDQFPSGIYIFVIKTLRKTAVRKVLKN